MTYTLFYQPRVRSARLASLVSRRRSVCRGQRNQLRAKTRAVLSVCIIMTAASVAPSAQRFNRQTSRRLAFLRNFTLNSFSIDQIFRTSGRDIDFMAMSFPSTEYFEALKAQMAANEEKFRRLGFIDTTFGVSVGLNGKARNFVLEFEVFDLKHVSEVPAIYLKKVDFQIEGQS